MASTDTSTVDVATAFEATAPRLPADRRALRLSATPIAILVVLGLLYLWVSSHTLDSIEQRTLNSSYIRDRLLEHLRLSLVATAIVVLLAIPLGILLTRPGARFATPFALAVANLGQSTPAIGLLVLLTIKLGVGFRVAMIGLVAYAVLPVLRNTIVGIEQVDPALVEASRGMGMTSMQTLRRVEVPLAVPVILAGLRTALVLTVGVATLATFVNAGGLGDIIVNGIKLQRDPVLITGSVLVACVAFGVDWLGAVAEDLLRPKGM